MARARNLAVAAAAGMTISAGLFASPALAATDSFNLCAYPLNCSAASVSGSLSWDTNVLTGTAVNNSYSSIAVTITRSSGTATQFTVARGNQRWFTSPVAATDTRVQIRLCPAATTCTSVTLTRH